MTDKYKRQSPKTNRYRSKKTWTKTQGPKLESKTNFKGRYSYLEGYIFGLGLIPSYKFARLMKDVEWYLRETYRDSCQPAIITDTPTTFLDP